MKTILIIAAVTPALIGSAAHAQQAPKPIPRADYIKTVTAHFSAMDTNHDGQVTKPELVAEVQREMANNSAKTRELLNAKFKQLDTNKDGQLSPQEFQALASPPKVQSPEAILAQLDSNHDGKISTDEFLAPELAKFNKVDANHDGIVTPAEIQAANGRK